MKQKLLQKLRCKTRGFHRPCGRRVQETSGDVRAAKLGEFSSCSWAPRGPSVPGLQCSSTIWLTFSALKTDLVKDIWQSKR